MSQTWQGDVSTDWFDGDNWVGGTVPTGAEDVVIDTTTPNPTVVTDRINNGTALADELTVGDFVDGSLTISDGGAVTNVSANIADEAGSTGSVLVTGSDSIWTNTGDLRVGHHGNGMLTISDGGTVTVERDAYLGDRSVPTSHGSALVTGFESTLVVSDDLRVGNLNTGTLDVLDGGAVFSNRGLIGRNGDAVGTVVVDGAGSIWSVTENMEVGFRGDGSLTVSGGAAVTAQRQHMGREPDGYGEVTVTGSGSSLSATNDVTVGYEGRGKLTISDGGLAESTGFNGIVGYWEGSVGEATVTGSGSRWIVERELNVGYEGTGTLTISDGGTAQSRNTNIGELTAGAGTLLVTGSGSTLTSRTEFEVGRSGKGTLTISDNGLVDHDSGAGTVNLASLAGSSGTINIGSAAGEAAAAPGMLSAREIEFGDGSATLVFNHTSDALDFAPDLISDGTGSHSVLLESGTTTPTGDLSAFTGSIDVDGGTLAGVFTTGGTINVNGGGTIAPGNSIGTTNTVDVTFDPGSVYAVEIDAAGNSDLIQASGSATLNGGTVTVSGSPGAFSGNYTILTAGSLTGTFDTVIDTLFMDNELAYDANNVFLTSTVRGSSFCDFAVTANQQTVACNGLDSLPITDAIPQAILALTSPQEARAAYDALSGQIHPSLSGALLQNGQSVVGAVNDRIRAGSGNPGTATSTAAFGGLAPGANGFWITGYGSWGDTDATANTAQMDNDLGGVVFGLDREVAEYWRFGVLGGYGRSDVSQGALSSSADADSWSIGLYGGAEKGATTISFGGLYSWHSIDSSRTAAFPGFSQTLTASYDAQSWQLFAEAGHQVELRHIMLEPFAGISYMQLDTDGFTETGGSAALTAASSTNSTTFTTLGVRSGLQLAERIRTHGMVGWRHAFGDTDPSTAFTLSASSPFTVQGAPIAEDALVTAFGLEASLTDNALLGLSYNGQYGDGTTVHGINATFLAKF